MRHWTKTCIGCGTEGTYICGLKSDAYLCSECRESIKRRAEYEHLIAVHQEGEVRFSEPFFFLCAENSNDYWWKHIPIAYGKYLGKLFKDLVESFAPLQEDTQGSYFDHKKDTPALLHPYKEDGRAYRSMKQSTRDALAWICALIPVMLQEAYVQGTENGVNLLKHLSSGMTTNEGFEQSVQSVQRSLRTSKKYFLRDWGSDDLEKILFPKGKDQDDE